MASGRLKSLTEPLQPILLGICLGELVFFVYYMFTFEFQKQSTISDTLFTTPAYAVVLSVALATRLLGGAFYLWRFKFEHQGWEIAGYIGIVTALFSWGWLVGHKDNVNHFGGVAGFCAGSFLYSIAFIRISALFEKHRRDLQIYLEMFLIVSTVALVVAFVALWFEEEQAIQDRDGYTRRAYIVEHVAYLVHLVFYGVFFTFNSPDPNKPKPAGEYGAMDYCYYEDEASACRPLIQMKMIPRVPLIETRGQY